MQAFAAHHPLVRCSALRHSLEIGAQRYMPLPPQQGVVKPTSATYQAQDTGGSSNLSCLSSPLCNREDSALKGHCREWEPVDDRAHPPSPKRVTTYLAGMVNDILVTVTPHC